ncbi:hypothetical protein [Thiobacillus sedimenti]|uniref:Restriction endonuclease n=1 Tax=Thiobacillus sedimenti TaxID=3110231 RepID=A0ABZ1CJ37_9PROT|nr:hypothetical protein [Thiobacillus sp. SCUT-2]WRS37953.1 hypothetical protein VA613_07945 [Thiobacillus sp. SCUT-2]
MMKEKRSYPVPTHSIPWLQLSAHVADLIELQSFFESRGISTNNTRIDRYKKYLEQATSGNPINEAHIFKNISDTRFQSDLDWKLYVLREVHELMWILKGLKVHIPKGVDDKLRKIIGGSDFAALDTHTESRNTQFELRIASYFCQAGCEVDLSTGTDVIATTAKHAFYLECKRIASSNNFRQNLIKARNQLIERMPRRHDNKKTYGFIAADVTKVAFAHNGLTFGLTNDHARDVVQDKLIKIGDSTMDMPMFSGCRNLLYCWLQIHIPSLITHPPTTATRFSSYGIPTSNLDRRSRQALGIFEAIITTLGNRPDAREIPPEKLIRRTTVSLPAGAIFWFEEQLLEAFLEGSDNYSKTSDEVIAGLTFDGVEHEFTLMDFEMLAADMPISERQRLASSPDSTRLELIMKMYIQRYPFENA